MNKIILKYIYLVTISLFVVKASVYGKDPNYSFDDGENINTVITKASPLPDNLRKSLLDYFNLVLEESSFNQSRHVGSFPELHDERSYYAYNTFRVKTEKMHRFILITSLVYSEKENFCRVGFVYNLEETSIYHERFGYQIVRSGTLTWRPTEDDEWKISPKETGGVIGIRQEGGVLITIPSDSTTNEERVPLVPSE